MVLYALLKEGKKKVKKNFIKVNDKHLKEKTKEKKTSRDGWCKKEGKKKDITKLIWVINIFLGSYYSPVP